MAFVIKKGSTYTWPVKFETPISGGKRETNTFDIEFKRSTRTEIAALLDTNDTELARKVIVGWAGIKDEAGAEIPFSEKSLEELLEVPGLSTAVTHAFLQSVSGEKAKN